MVLLVLIMVLYVFILTDCDVVPVFILPISKKTITLPLGLKSHSRKLNLSIFFNSADDASRYFNNLNKKEISGCQSNNILWVSLERLDLGPDQNILQPNFRYVHMIGNI